MSRLRPNNDFLRGLRALSDLEGGRRDLAGLLTRAAALVRDELGLPGAAAALSLDSSALITTAREGAAVLRTDPWEGPGQLGRMAMEEMRSVLWTAEDGLETPSALDLCGFSGLSSWAAVPLDLDRPARGLLCAFGDAGRPVDEAALGTLEVVASHLEICVQNLLAYQKTEALALTDELTRLYNFRFLKAALRREMERASRYGQVFSIIMIDVDHLKRYNDSHGHLGGSELLRRLAAILSRSSRAIDLVAKYGGDEFLVILPQTRLEGAVTMANRIRAAVAETAFPHCRPGDMTISVGVASYPQHGDSVNALVAAADTALFQAKRKERNCVVAADAPGNPGPIHEIA